MIQLQITMTGRGYGKNDEYRRFGEATKYFADIEAAREWLKEQYGKCKRGKIYRDRKDGTSYQVGYIYSFNNADWSHSPVDKWRQQDWVSFQSVETMNLEELR